MLTFLFWNIHGNDLTEVLGELALEHSVDVLVLAESEIPSDSLAATLSAGNDARFHYAAGREPSRVEFYTKFDPEYLTPTLEDARYSIRRLKLPGRIEITVVAAHLVSPLRAPTSRPLRARQFAADIKQAERRAEDARTLVFGDLNMNPFDEGVAALDALNGVMSLQTAQKVSRRHSGKDYPFFYNPMWARMGSHPNRATGTYYY